MDTKNYSNFPLELNIFIYTFTPKPKKLLHYAQKDFINLQKMASNILKSVQILCSNRWNFLIEKWIMKKLNIKIQINFLVFDLNVKKCRKMKPSDLLKFFDF